MRAMALTLLKLVAALLVLGVLGLLGILVTLDSLIRMSSNPFFPYMLERIEEGIGGLPAGASKAAASSTRLGKSPVGNKPAAAGTAK